MLANILFAAALLANEWSGVQTAGNLYFSSSFLLGTTVRVTDTRDAERLISAILDKYNDAGFPFCRVRPEICEDEDGRRVLRLTINEGPRVTIDELLIRSGRTDAAAARRLAGFKPGLYFSARNTERAKRRLMATGAFEGITDNILERQGRYHAVFLLDEKNSDWLTLSGSFSGAQFNLGAAFASRNILGTLRQMDFNYEYQRLFSFAFREPVLIAPAQLDADFSILTYDSARATIGQVRFTAPVGPRLKVSLLSGIELSDQYADDTSRQHGSHNLLGAGLSYRIEQPGWSTAQALHFDHLFRDADRTRFAYDAEFSAMRLFVQVHYRRVSTADYGFFDYLRIGGARSLRGYAEDEFTATRAWWLNLEYRRRFVFPVLDVGRVDGILRYAYGFGIRAGSKLADASLIIAWPGAGKWLDGKIHLSFVRSI